MDDDILCAICAFQLADFDVDVDKATVKAAPALPGGALRVSAYVVERDGAWAVTSSRTTLMV